ncbi:MAG TPA: hypothetical protein VFV38_33750 [Ktedonobacteraceae bacterium]|nr:hypothetical protein [Ktedonobacteraceae bacterium]
MSWGTTNLGTAYVMWSSHCQTNWGRVVMNENHTDPACIILNDDQCWYRIEATMWLLGFDSSGHYDGQETYLPLSTDGPDYCDHNCGGSNIFYGNMYYAPTAEVMVKGKAYSENGDVFPEGCPYTGASWKYSSQQPVC